MIAKTLFACVSVLAALAAQAADIKLIASPGVRGVLNELVPRFEQASGHKVAVDFAVIAVLKRRVEAGETFDVIVPGPELIQELVAQKKVAADTAAPLGRTGIAPARCQGHRSFARRTERIHFREALRKLGIEEELRPRLHPLADGTGPAALASGEVDITAGGSGAMVDVPGLQVLGGLPRELQTYVNFSIGVAVDSRSPEAARALARYLRSPDVAGVFRAKGMERID